jgi:hypothetical protein
MKVKTRELAGAALDLVVAKCEGLWFEDDTYIHVLHDDDDCLYSTDWAQGGYIIEREKMHLCPVIVDDKDVWHAWSDYGISDWRAEGPTPLVAAMRAYVASKLGDEVEVLDELMQ